MANRKSFKISSIILSVLFSLFLLAAIATIVFLIRDIKGDGNGDSGGIGGIIGDIVNGGDKNTFSLKYNGEALKDGDCIELPESGQVRFDVDSSTGYVVQVVPNVTTETDFVCTINGVAHSFSGEKEFTDFFVSSSAKQTDHFTINCSYEVYAVESVMSYYYGSDVYAENIVDYPFKLIVTPIGGSAVSVGLRQSNTQKTLKFDKTGVIVF